MVQTKLQEPSISSSCLPPPRLPEALPSSTPFGGGPRGSTALPWPPSPGQKEFLQICRALRLWGAGLGRCPPSARRGSEKGAPIPPLPLSRTLCNRYSGGAAVFVTPWEERTGKAAPGFLPQAGERIKVGWGSALRAVSPTVTAASITKPVTGSCCHCLGIARHTASCTRGSGSVWVTVTPGWD